MPCRLHLAPLWFLIGCLDLDSLQRPGPDGSFTAFDSSADAPNIPDGGSRDLVIADLPTTSGCADGRGTNIGAGSPFPVWTCPGSFAGPSSFFGRCASGFTNCRVIEIGDTACTTAQGGIFVGRKGYRQMGPFPPDGSQASYTWDGGGNQTRGIMYCGTPGTGGYLAPAGAAGFFRVVQCDSGSMPGVSSFGCPIVAASDQDFASVSNSDSANGVLCCPSSTQ